MGQGGGAEGGSDVGGSRRACVLWARVGLRRRGREGAVGGGGGCEGGAVRAGGALKAALRLWR